MTGFWALLTLELGANPPQNPTKRACFAEAAGKTTILYKLKLGEVREQALDRGPRLLQANIKESLGALRKQTEGACQKVLENSHGPLVRLLTCLW